MKFITQEMFNESIIDELNDKYLLPLGYCIEEGEELEPYTNYFIKHNGEIIYRTIYPVEMLVKVAQLLPESIVTLTAFELKVGDDPPERKETLRLSL